jgi:mannitol operon transcriptional antiterminator
MYISYRQRMILDILIRDPFEVTLHYIANVINVSTRTIHRELSGLEQILQKYDLILHKKSGVGIQIAGEAEKIKLLKKDLMGLTPVEYTSEERKLLILAELLTALQPIKLISLAIDYETTISVITHDLDVLELRLKPYQLSLIRRRGYGVELAGTEMSIRNAIIETILEHLNEYELLSVIKGETLLDSWLHNHSATQQLFRLLDKAILVKVEHALRGLEQKQAFPLTPDSYIHLVIYLVIMLSRREMGRVIPAGVFPPSKSEHMEELKIAHYIIEQLTAEGMDGDFSQSEIAMLVIHLKGAKLHYAPNPLNQYSNVEMLASIRKLIKLCEQRLKVALSQDHSLFEGLLMHIVPTLHRISNHKVIKNPLLSEIQLKYKNLYDVIEAAAREVFPALSIPEAEIGYLVMHFGSSMERNGYHRHTYRVLVVCLTGIGTSKMLASRIHTEFPEMEIKGNMSWSEAQEVPKTEYDMIISTTPLPMNEEEYLIVSPLLPPDAIQKTRLFMARMRSQNKFAAPVLSLRHQKGNSLQRLQSLHRYMDHIVGLLEGFKIYEIDNALLDFSGILQHIAATVLKEQVIREVNGFLQHLEKRCSAGGIAIPGSNIVLLHTRNDEVLKTSLSLHVLNRPLEEYRADEEKRIQSIILMIAPEEMITEKLEVLSEISVLLLDSSTIDVINTANKELITDYLAMYLESFCENLIIKEKNL